jgi:hypothetical protein
MPVAKKNQIIEDDDDDLEEDAVEASLQTV